MNRKETIADALDDTMQWALDHNHCENYAKLACERAYFEAEGLLDTPSSVNLSAASAAFHKEFSEYERLARKYGRVYNEAVDRFVMTKFVSEAPATYLDLVTSRDNEEPRT